LWPAGFRLDPAHRRPVITLPASAGVFVPGQRMKKAPDPHSAAAVSRERVSHRGLEQLIQYTPCRPRGGRPALVRDKGCGLGLLWRVNEFVVAE
jgi:hypothetical protein